MPARLALARDGSTASRLTRRANALVLLDKGWSCQQVAEALLLNDDTIRRWHKLFEQRGIEGLTSSEMGGSAGFLSVAQEEALKAFVGAHAAALDPRGRRLHRTRIWPDL
jgi:transposase